MERGLELQNSPRTFLSPLNSRADSNELRRFWNNAPILRGNFRLH